MFFSTLVFSIFLHFAKAGNDYYERGYGEYFEGSILISCDEVRLNYDETTYEEAQKAGTCSDDLDDRRSLRTGDGNRELEDALELSRLWPGKVNGKTKINYSFRDDSFDEDTKALIREQAGIIGEKSGVLIFSEEENQSEGYITIVKSSSCAGFVGKSKFQPQRLFLGDDCIEPKDIKRLFLQSVGMWHEQSRSDRDDYIQVLSYNIEPGKESNFAKRNTASLGNRYDYGSIMHFGANDFSINDFPTILSKGNEIGVTEEMSTSDITQLRLMYQCVSGPRDFSAFFRAICSTDCQCWEGQRGCVINQDCQGALVCLSKTCQVAPPTPRPTQAPTKPPTKPPTHHPTHHPTKQPVTPPTVKKTPAPRVRVQPPPKQCRGKTHRQCKAEDCCKTDKTRPAGKQCVGKPCRRT